MGKGQYKAERDERFGTEKEVPEGMVRDPESSDERSGDRERKGRWWSRKLEQGSQKREAEDGVGMRRPKDTGRKEAAEVARGRVTPRARAVQK